MEKKLITEMKFMMERLENPRMTYTQYEKKRNNLIKENTKYTELKPLEDILLKNGFKWDGDDTVYNGRVSYINQINEINKAEVALFPDYTRGGIKSGSKVLREPVKFSVRILYFVPIHFTFSDGGKMIRGEYEVGYHSIKDAEEELKRVMEVFNETYPQNLSQDEENPDLN